MTSMSTLYSDLFYDILKRVDGATLARAGCACAVFNSITREEKIWENVCESLWPSTRREDVKTLINSVGGFRKFYADCYPLIVNKDVPLVYSDPDPEYVDEWSEAEYYGDTNEIESISPGDFVSIVDVSYNKKAICSKVVWGIPGSDGFHGWFYNCPFRIDLLSYTVGNDGHEPAVTLSDADGLPTVPSIERERKDGKLWRDLWEGIRLSWIVVNPKMKQAVNLASWKPLMGRRHWPTDEEFLVRFGSVLPANDILPCQAVECIIAMKFRLVSNGGGAVNGKTSLELTELNLQLEDMAGAHVNGRNSLLILKEALSSRRSKNYSEVLESCHLYSKAQNELREEKLRYETRLDRVCVLSGIAVLASLCYCMM